MGKGYRCATDEAASLPPSQESLRRQASLRGGTNKRADAPLPPEPSASLGTVGRAPGATRVRGTALEGGHIAPGKRNWNQCISDVFLGVSRSVQVGEAFPTRAEKLGKRNTETAYVRKAASSELGHRPGQWGSTFTSRNNANGECGVTTGVGGDQVCVWCEGCARWPNLASGVRQQWTMSDMQSPQCDGLRAQRWPLGCWSSSSASFPWLSPLPGHPQVCLSVSRAVRGSLGLMLASAAWRSEDGVAPLPRPSSLLESMKTP